MLHVTMVTSHHPMCVHHMTWPPFACTCITCLICHPPCVYAGENVSEAGEEVFIKFFAFAVGS